MDRLQQHYMDHVTRMESTTQLDKQVGFLYLFKFAGFVECFPLKMEKILESLETFSLQFVSEDMAGDKCKDTHFFEKKLSVSNWNGKQKKNRHPEKGIFVEVRLHLIKFDI